MVEALGELHGTSDVALGIVRAGISILESNQQIHVSRYQLCLPAQKELCKELVREEVERDLAAKEPEMARAEVRY